MIRRIDHLWRLIATAIGFSAFGLGGLVATLTLFPLLHVTALDQARAYRRCQFVVHLSFRLFIWLMCTLGVLAYERSGAEKLKGIKGALILANHPTLIDVVFIVAMLPTTLCVVKRAAWSNPFLAGVMRATGYIQSGDPFDLVAACVESLERGNNLVIFPEATRTRRGGKMVLRRGAASVIRASRRAFIPVIITCDPPALSKEEKWYEIPSERVYFKITVGDRVKVPNYIVEGKTNSMANRRINDIIEKLFLAGIGEHGRAF